MTALIPLTPQLPLLPPPPQPSLTVLPPIWSQLDLAHQQQLAQLLAELIQRIQFAAPGSKEGSDDQP